MSERVPSALELFHDESLAQEAALPSALSLAAREVRKAAHGGTLEILSDAAVDAVQGSKIVPLAATSTLIASTVSSAVSPVLAAAQNFSRGPAIYQKAHTPKPSRDQLTEVSFALQPGGTIYAIDVKEAPIMGVSLNEAIARTEAASGIAPDKADDLAPGTEIDVPLGDSDFAVVPQGSDLDQLDAEYGLTEAEMLKLNPEEAQDPNLVLAGQVLRIKAPHTSTAAATPAMRQTHPAKRPAAVHHTTTVKPHTKRHSAVAAPKSHSVSVKPVKTTTITTELAPHLAPIKTLPKIPLHAINAAPESTHTTHTTSNPGFQSMEGKLTAPYDQAGHMVQESTQALTEKTLGSIAMIGGNFLKDLATQSTTYHPGTHHQASKPAHQTAQYHEQSNPKDIDIVKCSPKGVTLPGSTTAQIAFNYFVTCDNYSPAQASGIVGNLDQESNVEPERVQGDGIQFSSDPYDAGEDGWGIGQWTPGYKVLTIAADDGIHTPIYKLQTQLEIVNDEMENVSPTGNRDIQHVIRMTHNPAAAAEQFEAKFEEGPIAYSGGGQLASRQKYARNALSAYGDSALKLKARVHGWNDPFGLSTKHSSRTKLRRGHEHQAKHHSQESTIGKAIHEIIGLGGL